MKKDLYLALAWGDVAAVEDLYQQDSRVLSEVTFHGDTPLHIAVRQGNLDLVSWILQKEPSLAEARNNDNNTPLHEASKIGSPDQVEILLEHNTCVPECNSFGETALLIASKYGHVEAVKLLLGVMPYDYTTETHHSPRQWGGATSLLHAAVYGGKLEIVVAILDHRVDDNSWHNDLMTEKNKSGRCAIHVAAMKGDWNIINQFILERPDCIEIRSSDHKSVLHFAVEYNQLRLVMNLLGTQKEDRIAELVCRDHDLSHNTTLHLAALNAVDPQV